MRLRNGRFSTVIVEKLGPEDDVEAWAKARAEELTALEKERSCTVKVEYSPVKQIASGEQRLFDGEYLFLQGIIYKLGLPSICKAIEGNHRFEYDLEPVLSRLVYGRILEPASKRSTCAFAQGLVEEARFEQHQVYRALEVLAEESGLIQTELYKNSKKAFGRKSGVPHYDCTNYFFEIGQEDGFRKYGLSKEHRPSPIVQMGLFVDAEGVPLAFLRSPGQYLRAARHDAS